MTTDRAMRASDQDREHVVEILRAQYAEGRLTLEEFDERMASAYAGKTWGDLADLTSDLPVDSRFGPRRPAMAQDQPPALRPQGSRPVVPRWMWPLAPVLVAVTVIAAMPWGMSGGHHHHVVSFFPVWLLIAGLFLLRRAAFTHRGRRGPFG
jgi:DUF1707 SHOCT-like domain